MIARFFCFVNAPKGSTPTSGSAKGRGIESVRRGGFPEGTGRRLKLIRRRRVDWRRASSSYLSNGLLPARIPSLSGYNRHLQKEPRVAGKSFQAESRYSRFHDRKSFVWKHSHVLQAAPGLAQAAFFLQLCTSHLEMECSGSHTILSFRVYDLRYV